MDDPNVGPERPAEDLISRPPTESDLVGEDANASGRVDRAPRKHEDRMVDRSEPTWRRKRRRSGALQDATRSSPPRRPAGPIRLPLDVQLSER